MSLLDETRRTLAIEVAEASLEMRSVEDRIDEHKSMVTALGYDLLSAKRKWLDAVKALALHDERRATEKNRSHFERELEEIGLRAGLIDPSSIPPINLNPRRARRKPLVDTGQLRGIHTMDGEPRPRKRKRSR